MNKSAVASARATARRLTAIAGTSLLLAGCGRAPSFNIMGSFFPAWLICMAAGVTFAAIVNWIFIRCQWDKNVPWGILVYPSLAAFFAFTMWLTFFA